MVTYFISCFFIIVSAFWSQRCDAELLFDTHGMLSFAPYIIGKNKTSDVIQLSETKTQTFYPAYRAEFISHIDFFRRKNLILTGQVGNTTVISTTDSSLFSLNRIHYIFAPGIRYELRNFIIRSSFHHESIYSLSRSEILARRKGPYAQNSIRLGVGSRGSYYLYLRDEYRNVNDTFLNSFDAQVNVGVFLRGSESIWTAKNNPYRYEEFSLIRYHLGVFNRWVYFASFRQFLWKRLDSRIEQNINITLNTFKKGAENFFGIFLSYTLYDNSVEDNENKLGSLGIRVLF